MKPEFIVGYVEIVYNANGHTCWLEGVINDEFVETHWDGNQMHMSEGLEKFIKSINPEYWPEYIESHHSGWKNYYSYNIWW
jgi:hypothetical protein